MSSKDSIEQRDLLERRASAVRLRLMRAVDALDARRHRVEELGARAKSAAIPVLVGAAAAALLLGAFGVSIGARLVRRHRSMGDRFRVAVREMDLVRPPPLRRRVFDRLVLAVAGVLATALAKRTAGRLINRRANAEGGQRIAARESALRLGV